MNQLLQLFIVLAAGIAMLAALLRPSRPAWIVVGVLALAYLATAFAR